MDISDSELANTGLSHREISEQSNTETLNGWSAVERTAHIERIFGNTVTKACAVIGDDLLQSSLIFITGKMQTNLAFIFRREHMLFSNMCWQAT